MLIHRYTDSYLAKMPLTHYPRGLPIGNATVNATEHRRDILCYTELSYCKPLKDLARSRSHSPLKHLKLKILDKLGQGCTSVFNVSDIW